MKKVNGRELLKQDNESLRQQFADCRDLLIKEREENELRRKYESFLKSIIMGKEFLPEEHGFKWFCEWEGNNRG